VKKDMSETAMTTVRMEVMLGGGGRTGSKAAMGTDER
jgi:hypothetical protein